MSDPRQTSIRDLLAVLTAQRFIICACVALAVGLALSISLSQEKKYTSSASLAFEDQSQDLALIGTTSGVAEPAPARAVRESNTLLSLDVLQAVANDLRPISVADLRKSVAAAPENTSNLVVVTATAADAMRAAAIANAVVETAAKLKTQQARRRFSAAARDLEKRAKTVFQGSSTDVATQQLYRERVARLDALASVSEPVTVAAIAEPPSAPSSPTPLRTGLLAAFAGLLIGVVAAFLRNALDRRFRDSYDIREQLALPLLGYVSNGAMGKTGFSANGRKPMEGDDLEAFRMIRANLEFLSVNGPANVILVTSALPQEGKSTVASSLAYISALSNQRTLLIECDLRRPSMASRLHVDPEPGLVQLIAHAVQARDVVRSFHVAPVGDARPDGGSRHTLDCAFAGGGTAEAAELLASSALREFILAARQHYDVVIIDSAPLLPVADTFELFTLVDTAILCVRDGRTTRDDAEAGKTALMNIGDRPIGIVVTGVRPHDSAYSYYAHNYSYTSR